MKPETKLFKLIDEILTAKKAKKELESKIEKAEETIVKLVGDVQKTSVERDGVVYSVTIGENVRYTLVEEGKRKMLNDVPFESALWKKTPDIGECLEDDVMKEYVIRKDFTPKVIIKTDKIKEGNNFLLTNN